MSEESAAIAALEQRVQRLESAVEPIQKLVAKAHQQANTLTVHAGHFDALLGPRDSLLMKVGEMEGTIRLAQAGIQSIKGTIGTIQDDVGKLVESYELQKANVVGLWQMRATMATAIVAALSAVAVAAMQFLP